MSLRRGCVALAAGLVALPWAAAQDEPLRARAAIQSQRVYVGQQFLLQIQVEGTDQPDPVDIGPLEADFAVSEAGGGSSNSTSVSIVNGRMTRQVQRGYNFNYRLAARRAGDLQIPSLTIGAGGRSVRTQPLALAVQPPEENDDFKLRLEISRARAYVGQPLTLTCAWYIGREVQNFLFGMPLLEDGRFEIRDLAEDSALRGQGRDDVIEIRLGDRTAVARRERGRLDGRDYTVLRFRKLLVPREPGSVQMPAATVTFDSPRPGQSRSRSPFDDLFGGSVFSGTFGRQPAMQTLAIPSNRPRLEVLDLPVAGRPAGFNGWIGQFEIEARALPTEVAVGEPITLSLEVRGVGHPPGSRPPSLDRQAALTRISKCRARWARASSATMPGISLRPCGPSMLASPRSRRSNCRTSIPSRGPTGSPGASRFRCKWRLPRIVTADDAEGLGAEPSQIAVESSEQGIAHNYVDASALVPMGDGWLAWLRALGPLPLALALLGLPPLACLALLAVRAGRRYGEGPLWRARSAHGQWRRAVAAIDAGSSDGVVAGDLLAALREYLGLRLAGSGSAAAAWTSGDAEAKLAELAASGRTKGSVEIGALAAALRSVVERCEVGSFAGGAASDADWRNRLLADARAAVDRIEESLR